MHKLSLQRNNMHDRIHLDLKTHMEVATISRVFLVLAQLSTPADQETAI